MSKITQLPGTENKKHLEEEAFFDGLMNVIYEFKGKITIAQALGVLKMVESDLMTKPEQNNK